MKADISRRAVFLDLEELADANSSLPNTLPPAEKFASRMQSLGLGDGSRIVVYDDSPFKSATRAWWMLTLFGAHDVAVLDGGIAKWKAEGRPLETGKPTLRHRHFTVWKDDKGVKTKADMLANLHSKDAEVVDARGAGRFTGEEAEPRPEMASGHIPGSRNLPYANLYNADGTWKRGDDLVGGVCRCRCRSGQADDYHVRLWHDRRCCPVRRAIDRQKGRRAV